MNNVKKDSLNSDLLVSSNCRRTCGQIGLYIFNVFHGTCISWYDDQAHC